MDTGTYEIQRSLDRKDTSRSSRLKDRKSGKDCEDSKVYNKSNKSEIRNGHASLYKVVSRHYLLVLRRTQSCQPLQALFPSTGYNYTSGLERSRCTGMLSVVHKLNVTEFLTKQYII